MPGRSRAGLRTRAPCSAVEHDQDTRGDREPGPDLVKEKEIELDQPRQAGQDQPDSQDEQTVLLSPREDRQSRGSVSGPGEGNVS
jgi:hypothetical protein